MGDLTADQYLCYGGMEIVNLARLGAYIAAGLGPSRPLISVCTCPGLLDLLKDDAGNRPTYLDPVTDGAPWYDPHPAAAALSSNFLGVYPFEISGLDDEVATASYATTVNGRVVINKRESGVRKVNMRLLLVGKTCCGTAYGLKWLRNVLADPSVCDSCSGADLTYFDCCPTATSPCGTVSAEPATGADVARTLLGVQVLEGPTIRSYLGGKGCGSCGCSTVVEVQLTMASSSPTAWRELEPVALKTSFSTGTSTALNIKLQKAVYSESSVTQTRDRCARPIEVRANGTWCPVGNWPITDLQQFGGECYPTVEKTTAANVTLTDPQPQCCPHGVILRYDPTNGVGSFESIGWVGDPNNPTSLPCDCAVYVAWIERYEPAVPPANDTDPGTPARWVREQPGSGDGCCAVQLSFTSANGGVWSRALADGQSFVWPLSTTTTNGTASTTFDNWPPTGCSLQIVNGSNCDRTVNPHDKLTLPYEYWRARRDGLTCIALEDGGWYCSPTGAAPWTAWGCVAGQDCDSGGGGWVASQDDCEGAQDAPIALLSNGLWLGDGTWAHRPLKFPEPGYNYTVKDSDDSQVVETIATKTLRSCSVCPDETDPFQDPECERPVPPAPRQTRNSCTGCRTLFSTQKLLTWSGAPQIGFGVPVFEFYSGTQTARNVELLVWENPLGLDPATNASSFTECNACAAWTIGFVPAGALIRIDGRDRRVYAVSSGGTTEVANRLLVSTTGEASLWPQFTSCPLVAAVKAERLSLDTANAYASLWIARADA